MPVSRKAIKMSNDIKKVVKQTKTKGEKMLKELNEKRAEASKAVVQLRDKISAEKRAFTAEEKTNFDKALGDYDSLTAQIDVIKRADDVAKEMEARKVIKAEIVGSSPANDVSEKDKELAFRGWIRFQEKGMIKDEERQAMEKIKFHASAKELEVTLHQRAPRNEKELRAMSIGTASAGGYTVPEGFATQLEEALLFYSSMRNVAEVIRTASGNDMPFPTVNDTGNAGVLVAEAGAVLTNADPVFSEVIFKAYKYTSKIIQISSELLEDSAFDLAGYLGRAIGERLGRVQNTACTTGTGSSQPNGIVTAATSTATAAAATLTADDIISLAYKVDASYAQGAAFMMSRALLGIIRKFKDSNDQYLWQPSLIAGEPEMILGYPVFQNSAMATAVATGNVVAIFGQLNKYKIREVNAIRMKRLVELYAGTDQEGFGGFMRFDGNLLDAGTHPVYKLTVA
jgi:HK97 family phage major capsid protein